MSLDDDVVNAIKMIENGIYIWVLDKDKKPCGWLDMTQDELSGFVREHFTTEEKDSFTIGKRQSLKEALNKMIKCGVNQLAVTDEEGEFVGEISIDDIIQKS